MSTHTNPRRTAELTHEPPVHRTARRVTPSPTDGTRILRRWSVAELIARAATLPPATA